MDKFTVQAVRPTDEGEWRKLFDGYADFYKVSMTDDIAGRVWAWLLDPGHVLEGLLARDAKGTAIGLAHIRTCPDSLRGGDVGFLDDLFVAPAARGGGVADAIFEKLKEMAAERDWQAIRWITQHFNERGRAFYDRYTHGPSDFIMYQLEMK